MHRPLESLDPGTLADAKARHQLTLSVCLPARNEETTIGRIIADVRTSLVERVRLVDEIVVVDDGSVDATAHVARREGARVYAVDTVLPDLPDGSGKGNALWKSLYVSHGDLICWIDADIHNFRADFVARLVAPLLFDRTAAFVKGYYRRPMPGDASGGGRVTELVARPLLSLLFPELAHFVQPLAGEYAGRRELLEAVPFVEGWGVEIGLLIDVVAQAGSKAVRQIDLGVREHRNRPLGELGPQAMAVLVTTLRRARYDRVLDVDRAVAELVRFDETLVMERVPVEVRERPPMLTVPAYRAKLGREQTA